MLKRYKRIFFGVFVSMLTFTPSILFAQSGSEPDLTKGPPPMTAQGMMQALTNVADWLFVILMITAVIFLIIAAFNFLFAQGDPEKIKKAKVFVLYSLIGVGVAVASRGLVMLVYAIIAGGNSWWPF
jgi:hypothetical protein